MKVYKLREFLAELPDDADIYVGNLLPGAGMMSTEDFTVTHFPTTNNVSFLTNPYIEDDEE